MADEKYKIKIEVDDSAEKQYEAEFKSRLKVKTATAIEEEKRKTAQLKGEVEKSVQSQLEAERQGNKMKIKEAIAYRKIMESQLRLHEQDVRLSNAKDLSEFRSLLKEKERLQKQADRDIRNAPRTMLRGETGSLSRLGQVNNALSGMTFGTDQYKATEQLSKNLTANLNKVGVDTRNLAQKIGGELKGAIGGVGSELFKYGAALATVSALQQAWNISLESARFDVMKSNFKGATQDLENFRIATAGNVTDGGLIKLSNQATDLGVGLKEQTILFSLAEDAADKYGTSIEEGFQKVVYATEGNIKGLKSIGIQKAQYEEIVKSLANAHGKEIDQLDAETQKEIRLQAIIQASGVTYEDAINKQKDLADKHEVVSTTLGNLKEQYGKYITTIGLLDKFMSDAIKTGNRQIELWQMTKMAIKNLADEWGILKREAETPIRLQIELSAPSLKEVRKGFTGTYEDAVRQLTLAKGISWEEAQKMIDGIIPSGKENEANSPNKSTSNSGSKNSGKTDSEEKQLTFLEELRKKIADVQTEIASLNNDLKDTNLKEYERLRIEEKLVEKRAELNDLIRETIAIANGERSAVGGDKPIAKGAGKPKNPRAGNDPRGDMPSEEIDKLLNGVQLSFEDIKSTAENIVTPFQNILQLAGLTESSFGQILQMIQSVLNTGSGIFGMVQTLLSFIPGGSVIGGIISAIGGASGGGGIGSTSGGGLVYGGNNGLGSMSSGMRMGSAGFSGTVIVNSEVEKTKSVKFYQNTFQDYSRRQAVKSL